MNQFDEHNHDPDQSLFPDSLESQNSQIEFTQYLRCFSPRSALLDLAELRAEMIPDQAADPVLFPAQSAATQASMIHSSWPRVALAWACGMVMGAAFTSVWLNQMQSRSPNEPLSDRMTAARISDDKQTDSINLSPVKSRFPNQASISPVDRFFDPFESNFAENRPLTALYGRGQVDTQSNSIRDRHPQSISETQGDDLDSALPDSSFEINFEPTKPKSQRHILMKELLTESI